MSDRDNGNRASKLCNVDKCVFCDERERRHAELICTLCWQKLLFKTKSARLTMGYVPFERMLVGAVAIWELRVMRMRLKVKAVA